MRDQKVAVIGGGLAGLSAAYSLVRKGAVVTLLEGSGSVGGRAATDELDGHRIDSGAQLFAGGYTRFLSLVREIGLASELRRVPGRDALWSGGRAHEVVYGSVTSMLASRGLPMRTKLKMGSSYVPFLSRHSEDLDLHAPARAARAGLDDESIEAWGKRQIDGSFVDSLVYPQLGAFYGALPEETSAGFYHILAKLGMEVDLYGVAGGVGAVSARLAERLLELGADVRLGAPVHSLELDSFGVRLQAGGGEERFDGVIPAIPAPRVRELLGGSLPELDRWLSAVRYRPTLSLAILLDSPTPVRYFGLSFPRGETRFVSAISVQENKGVPLVPEGRGLLVAFPTPESAPALLAMDSRAVLDAMLPEIAVAIPRLDQRIIRARVYRWEPGSPVFFPGYLAHLDAFNGGRPERDSPLALAGDYLVGPSVEGAVSSALDAAERLGRRFG